VELLTIKEIARRLDMPESTVRYHRDMFEEYIPAIGEGRKKRYEPVAVDILRTIAEGMQRNLTRNTIANQLAIEYAINLEIKEEQQQTTTKQDKLNIEQVMPLFETINNQAETIKQQAAFIEQLTQQNRRSWWPFKKGKH